MLDVSAYERRAAKLASDYEAATGRIKNDSRYTADWKRSEMAKAAELHARAMAELHAEAAAALAEARRLHENAARHAASEAVRQKRQLLGDALFADVVKRQLSSAEPAEILADVQGAQDPWLKTLLLEYGRAELKARAKSEAPARELYRLEELSKQLDPVNVKLQAEAAELSKAEAVVRKLNPGLEAELRQRFQIA